MRSNLRCKTLMRSIIFGHHQQSAGILIDAMHNTGTMFTVDTGQAITAMIHQRIDQRAGPVPGRRMHHHAAWLIDNNDIRIFVDDIQWDILRHKINLA